MTDHEPNDLPRAIPWLERPAWHEHAACRGLTKIMFPPSRIGSKGGRVAAARAKAVCAACPVADECRDWALTELPDPSLRYGHWGGLEPCELIQLKHGRRLSPRNVSRARRAPAAPSPGRSERTVPTTSRHAPRQ